MKKRISSLLLLVTPIVLSSCASYAGFKKVKEVVDSISNSGKNPYYRVIGVLDFNNELINVDATFDKNPEGDKFTPYARFNDGFYCEMAGDNIVENPEDVIIHGMASRSYWLRAPMRIDKDNFYVEMEDGQENPTCAHYWLTHMITSWMDETGSTNPSSCKAYFDTTKDGGFAIGGSKVHTKFRLDNYPYYPDPEAHPSLNEWDPYNPYPTYQSVIDAKVNVRFEYNAEGWLIKEELSSLGYNYNTATDTQISLKAVYNYKFA